MRENEGLAARRRILVAAALFGVLVVALLLIHHPIILSGFNLIHGDVGDARFANYCLEHTWLWITRAPFHENLWNPPFYYPAENAAAYSDLFLGFAPFYWIWRILGFAPDTSFQLWFMAGTAANLLSAWLLLRALGLARSSAIAGALFIACANSRIAQMNHPQLYYGLFVFLALYALARFLGEPPKAETARGRGWLWPMLFCAAFVLQCYSAFYPAFFLALTLIVCLGWALMRRASRGALLERLNGQRKAIVVCLLLGVAAMIPWIIHYGAAAMELGSRSMKQVNDLLPRPASWINMGPQNWLYGWTNQWDMFSSLKMEPEHRLGLGLLTTVVFLTGLLSRRKRPAARLMLVGIVATLLLTTGISSHPSPVWRLARHLIPGAGAIRAVARFGMLLAIPAGFGLGLLMERLRARGAWFGALGLLMAALCLLEQGQKTMPCYDKRGIRGEVARVAAAVPRDCVAFFYSRRQSGAPSWKIHIDAMWAALESGKPTINGYSGGNPRTWLLLQAAPGTPGDADRLIMPYRQWLILNHLPPNNTVWIQDGAPPPRQ